jgi:hypothetical protein
VAEVQAFRSADGGTVLVEVEPAGRPITRGRGSLAAVKEASETLEGVLQKLGPAVKGIVSELRATADWPDEVSVEFAVKISAPSPSPPGSGCPQLHQPAATGQRRSSQTARQHSASGRTTGFQYMPVASIPTSLTSKPASQSPSRVISRAVVPNVAGS